MGAICFKTYYNAPAGWPQIPGRWGAGPLDFALFTARYKEGIIVIGHVSDSDYAKFENLDEQAMKSRNTR